MYKRLCNLSKSNSFFLFGPRGTGKSTLLSQALDPQACHVIDLLDPTHERIYATHPESLIHYLESGTTAEWIVIDEIQKVPALLDIVHLGIERHRQKFALTGSSARKLRRGAANLLAGRAFEFHLHPLTALELGSDFRLHDCLSFGTLPRIFAFDTELDKGRFLNSYANTYLKEEIQVEQLVRKIEPFRVFLEVAAQSSGKVVNFAKLADQAAIGEKSVQRYFEILADTFLGFFLPAYDKSIRKRQLHHPKFYFFDIGVLRAIEGTLDVPVRERTYEYGRLFEHFIILECLRLNDYYEKNFRFSYLRTKDQAEVDLVVERPGRTTFFIEIKSSDTLSEPKLRPVQSLASGVKDVETLVLSRSPHAQTIAGTRVLPWLDGLRYIFESKV